MYHDSIARCLCDLWRGNVFAYQHLQTVKCSGFLYVCILGYSPSPPPTSYRITFLILLYEIGGKSDHFGGGGQVSLLPWQTAHLEIIAAQALNV